MRPFQEVAHGGDGGTEPVHVTFGRSTVHNLVRLLLKTAKVDVAHGELVLIKLKRLGGLSTCAQVVRLIKYHDASADVNPEVLPRRRLHHVVVRHEHDICIFHTVDLLVVGAEILFLAQGSEVLDVQWPPRDILGPAFLGDVAHHPSLMCLVIVKAAFFGVSALLIQRVPGEPLLPQLLADAQMIS
jgi:hypothetical protein